MNIIGILFILFSLALIAALAFAGENRRLRARLEAKQIREGYAWDWTKESERQARAAMELICDKCHEPYRCSQDELDAECAMCPVPDAVYRLARGTEGRIATAVCALPRNDSEEARG